MTQEEKQLLLKDLCARLPYNVVVRCTDSDTDYKCFLTTDILNEILYNTEYYDYKPYLRPMSSMTAEEEDTLCGKVLLDPAYRDDDDACFNDDEIVSYVDYCYSRHLDIHGLIHKGLALEAPEGMYKTE